MSAKEFQAVVDEGKLDIRTSPQAALDGIGSMARAMASAIRMHRCSRL